MSIHADAKMEPEAGTDTRIEVDLMILDYLVSTALESALHIHQTRAGKHVDANAIDWHTDTIRRPLIDFQSLLPSTQIMSEDAQARIRLLNLTNAFLRYTASPAADKMEILFEFLTLCNRGCPSTAEPQWTSVGAQLIAQIAIEVSNRTGRPIQDTLTQSTAQVDKKLKMDIGRKVFANYLSYFEPPPGVPLRSHTEQLSEKLGPDRLHHEISSILFEIVKAQEPPILIQLERGRLNGLSRAETLQLKERAGIR